MDIRIQFKDFIEEKGYSLTSVSKATSLSKTVLSLWMNGCYKGKNERITDIISNFIQREKEKSTVDDIPIVETSIFKYIFEIGRLCHTKGKIGVCVGKAGLGKTVAVKCYTKNFLDTILIESDSGYTAKSLLLEIHKRLGLTGKGSVYKLMEDVINKLHNSGRLLIIDEAENLPYRALEITRRIHDKTGIGILLVGRNILFANLKGFNNEYEQLYSRVKYHKLLDNLSSKDVEKILEQVNIPIELAQTFISYSGRNTRKLEHLITHSINVAKINKKDIDKAIIRKCSRLIMVRDDEYVK